MPEEANATANIRGTGLSTDNVSAAQIADCKESIKRAINTLLAQANANSPSVAAEVSGVDLEIEGVILSG